MQKTAQKRSEVRFVLGNLDTVVWLQTNRRHMDFVLNKLGLWKAQAAPNIRHIDAFEPGLHGSDAEDLTVASFLKLPKHSITAAAPVVSDISGISLQQLHLVQV